MRVAGVREFFTSRHLKGIPGYFQKQVFTQMSAHEHLQVPSRCVIRELRDGDVEAFVELRRQALFRAPAPRICRLAG